MRPKKIKKQIEINKIEAKQKKKTKKKISIEHISNFHLAWQSKEGKIWKKYTRTLIEMSIDTRNGKSNLILNTFFRFAGN